MAERDDRRSRRMPWAFAIGCPVMLLGLFSTVAGRNGPTVLGVAMLGVGLLLTCTGLIQRSIEKSR